MIAKPYDHDGYLRKVQKGAVALAIIFSVLSWFARRFRRIDDDEIMAFLAFGWGFTLLLGILVSALSFVTERRRGFLDMILTTPLSAREIVDGVLLSVPEHLWKAILLPVGLTVYFVAIGGLDVLVAFISMGTAALFVACVMVCGVAASLVAKSPAQALIGAVALPLAAIIGIVFIQEAFGYSHALVYLFAIPFMIAYSQASMGKHPPNSWTTGFYLVASHLLLCWVATCWTMLGDGDHFPGRIMHPAVVAMTVCAFDSDSLQVRHVEGYYPPFRRGVWYDGLGPWWLALGCYWSAMLATIWLARRFLIHRFEEIVDRARLC